MLVALINHMYYQLNVLNLLHPLVVIALEIIFFTISTISITQENKKV